jgi:predicted AlkP superfamily pyrophosphatase or phosphodiesterase
MLSKKPYTLRKLCIVLFFLLHFIGILSAQKNLPKANSPKLVVGIIVDQMRADYIHRFNTRWTQGGFNRFLNQGYSCLNNQYHYASTVTGPGHAHVYNGSTPGLSGIVGNTWYDKTINKTIYVASDSTVKPVGTESATVGKMSPANLKVSTIADQLRISTQFQSKTVGIAIKDRGAIMPVGHTGKAFWYDAGSQNWISSSFYMNALPVWTQAFNAKKIPSKLTQKPWELEPKSISSEEDMQAYENNLGGETSPVFPHKVSASNIASSPFGDDLTTQFALEAITGEGLGTDGITDLLSISYSSPDYVGHSFGPQSKEIEDHYIKLDKSLEKLFAFLDAKVGKNEYLVFLTADHGIAEIPGFLKKHKIPGGLFLGGEIKTNAEKVLDKIWGDADYIISEDNYQLYLNHTTLSNKKISIDNVVEALRKDLCLEEGIYEVVNLMQNQSNLSDYYANKLKGLYNPKRSGEIMVLVEPGYFEGYAKGTTHGTIYPYDAHVPLLWYGKGIKPGSTSRETKICDIAPTLAQILGILEPNGNTGQPILELFR